MARKRWSALELSKTLLFRTLTYRAAGFIGKPFMLLRVAQKALDKADKDSSVTGMASGLFESVQQLVRMIKAYASGSYRGVSRKNIILVVASILYFISPLDIVPDAIPVLGLLDDITLMTWVISTLGDELAKFNDHERTTSRDLLAMTYQDLYERAKQKGIPGRSGMSKQELVDTLQATA